MLHSYKHAYKYTWKQMLTDTITHNLNNLLPKYMTTYFLRYVISTFMPSLNKLMCMACLWTENEMKTHEMAGIK